MFARGILANKSVLFSSKSFLNSSRRLTAAPQSSWLYQERQSASRAFVTPSLMRSFSTNQGGAESEDAAKAAAKEFIQAVKEVSLIDEIADLSQWKTKVMDEKNKPIILDCYAEWCNPCQKLTPVLEKLTQEHDGKFRLVKLNIDNIPQLATGLNVKSIPALFLIYRGNVLDTVTGFDMKKVEDLVSMALLVE
jgi:thioredoxin